jgi:hypothetical protein
MKDTSKVVNDRKLRKKAFNVEELFYFQKKGFKKSNNCS